MHVLRKAGFSVNNLLKAISCIRSRHSCYLNEEARDRIHLKKPGDQLLRYILQKSTPSLWHHDRDPVQPLPVYKIEFRFNFKKRLHYEPHYKFEQELSERDNILKRDLKKIMESENKKKDVSYLTSLKISNLSPKVKPEPVTFIKAGRSFIQTCELQTYGVSYLHMASNLQGLPENLMPYVPLFCKIIRSIGTGDLHANPLAVSHHTDASRGQLAVLFSFHCLEKNFHKMLDLWSNVFNSPDFMDENQLPALIPMNASKLASSLGNGHQYAMSSSASTLNVVSKIQELFFGYSQVRTMKQVAEMPDFSEVAYKLKSIADVVLDKSSLRISVNATPTAMERSVQGIKAFLGNLNGEVEMAPIFPEIDQIKPTSHNTQFELPITINHVALSFPAVLYTHKDYMPLNVLAALMTRKFLHREIREKGGAKVDSGIFSFYSYRDPNSLETLDVFRQCVAWAAKGEFSVEDVNEAKLEIFQQIDTHVYPGDYGLRRFVYDISDDMRQKNRDRLFKVVPDDLKRVNNLYLNADGLPCGAAFLGPANSAVQKDKSWHVERRRKIVKHRQSSRYAV